MAGVVDASETDRRRRRGRRWTWILLGLLFFLPLAGLLLVVTVRARQADADLNAQIESLKARGIPVEFADLDPAKQGHDVSRGAQVLAALGSFPPESEDYLALWTGHDEVYQLPPGDYPPIAQQVVQSRPAIDRMLLLMRGHEVYLPRDYKAKGQYLLTYNDAISARPIMRLLTAEVLQSLGTDNPSQAIHAQVDQFELCRIYEHEPIPMCKAVQGSMLRTAVSTLAILLARAELSKDERQVLDGQLKNASGFRFDHAMQGETALALTTLNVLKQQNVFHRLWSDYASFALDSDQTQIRISMLDPSHLDRERSLLLQELAQAVDCIDQIGPQEPHALVALKSLGRHGFPLANAMVSNPLVIREIGLRVRQHLHNARLGLRVDEHYRRTGQFPATLAEIVDADLAPLLIGLRSGKPLVYETAPGRFQIEDTIDSYYENAFEVVYSTAEAEPSPESSSQAEP